MGVWDDYTGPQAAAVPQPTAAPKSGGGIGGFLFNSIVKPTVDAAKNLPSDVFHGVKAAGMAGASVVEGHHGAQLATDKANALAEAQKSPTYGGIFKGSVQDNQNKSTGQQLEKIAGTAGNQALDITAPISGVEGAVAKTGIKAAAKLGAKVGLAGGATSSMANGDDGGTVINNALIGGATGAVVGGAGGVVGKVASKVLGKDTGAATTTADNFLTKQGNKLAGDARGIKPGASAKGQDALGVEQAASHNQFLDSLGLGGQSAEKQLAGLEQHHADTSTALGAALEGANRPLSSNESHILGTAVGQKLDKIPGLAPEDSALANQLRSDLGNVKDVRDLQDFKNSLDSQINYNRSSGTSTPQAEQIRKGVRDEVARAIDTVAPETRPLNDSLSKSYAAQAFLKKSAANPPGGVNLLGPFGGPKVGGEAIQAASSKVGNLLKKLGGSNTTGKRIATEIATPKPASLVSKAVEPAVGAASASLAANAAPNAETTINNASKSALAAPDTASSTPSLGDGSTQSSADSSDNMYSKANMMSDIQRDPKNSATYLSLYKELNPASATPKALSSTASQQLGNAQSGLAAISQLKDEISKNGNVVNENAAAGVLPGVLGNLTRGAAGTQSYESARGEVTDILARLRTGAAISKEEESQYKALLPSAGDSPDTIQQKLDRYQTLFQGIADRAQVGSPSAELAVSNSQ